jgi:hypothetical protein
MSDTKSVFGDANNENIASSENKPALGGSARSGGNAFGGGSAFASGQSVSATWRSKAKRRMLNNHPHQNE